MKVVLDTNVLISAILGGRSARVLSLWQAGRFRVVASSEILAEYIEVLNRPKFKLPPEILDEIAEYLFRRVVFVTPEATQSPILTDPSDDKFLLAAVAGSVELIVSGDRHLLDRQEYAGIPIRTVRQFLHQFS